MEKKGVRGDEWGKAGGTFLNYVQYSELFLSNDIRSKLSGQLAFLPVNNSSTRMLLLTIPMTATLCQTMSSWKIGLTAESLTSRLLSLTS